MARQRVVQVVLSCVVLAFLAAAAVAQDKKEPIDLLPASGGPRRTPRLPAEPSATRMELGVSQAVRLATTYNSGLKVAYYNHLVDRTSISEAEARFEPVFKLTGHYGISEVIFPQIFPTGNVLPDGSPEFFQTIVNDKTDNANWTTSVSGIFPTGATYDLQISSDYRDREAGGLLNPTYQTTTSATLSQPILRNAWLQYNYANIRLARYAESQSRQRLRLDTVALIADVHDAYWNYVFSLWDLEVKKRSLEVARELLDINRVKVETGVFAPIEIAAAESGVADRVTDVLVAENAIKDNADRLRRLIMPFRDGSDWEVVIDPSDDPFEQVLRVPTLDELIEVALEERPDLAEARIGLRRQDIAVAVADNESMPRFDVTGQVSWTGLSESYGDSFLDSFGSTGAESWSIGLSLEVPLGNRAARSRLARSRLQRDQALLSYRDLQLGAIEEVRRNFRRVETAVKTIDSTRKAMELKREELRNEQIKLESKVTTNFQVLQVSNDLSLRSSQYLRALVDYRIALATLARSLGSSLEVLSWPIRP